MKQPANQSRTAVVTRICLGFVTLFILDTAAICNACAQASPATASATSLPEAPVPQNEEAPIALRDLPLQILRDQKGIWTSPLRLRTHDLRWLIPLAAATGASIATDHHTIKSVVSRDASFNQANVDASNVMVGGILIAPAALYGMGLLKHDQHARNTGLLGAEAIGDGVIVEQGMKLIFWRERPRQDNGRGLFFQGASGIDSSFPSSHSVLAWSSAAVIASEYPSWWPQLGVYSLATAVSLTRVLGQEHFPTDVLIGSTAGWLVGHYVYKSHHRRTRNLR